MEDRAHAIIAIAFLAVFSGGAVGLYFWVHSGTPETRTYVIVSPYSVGGLEARSAVKYKGLKVGSVKSIRFAPDDPEEVEVRIGVYPNAYVTRATYAKLAMQGITGGSYIQLSNSDDKPHTQLPTSDNKPARIPMKRGLMQLLSDSAQSDLKGINEAVASVNKLLNDENRRRIAQTITALQKASERLAALEKAVSPAVRSLPKLTADSDKALEQTRGLLRDARDAARQVADAAKQLSRISQSGKRLVDATSEDALPRVEALTRRLNRASSDIDRLVRQLRRQPQSLLLGSSPPSPGPGEPGFKPPE
jgi:phospholipid/cholesterol/gamma-HCH transport system substrate-binding protein